jgi:hypothetical protein
MLQSKASGSLAFGGMELSALIVLLCPKRIVAVGNDAAKSAARVASAQQIIQVRHPSYGGQADFLAQVRTIYCCRPRRLL